MPSEVSLIIYCITKTNHELSFILDCLLYLSFSDIPFVSKLQPWVTCISSTIHRMDRGGSSIGVWGGPLTEGDLGVWGRSPQENFSKPRPSNSLRTWMTPLLVYLIDLTLHHLADHLHAFSTRNLKMKLNSLSEH